MSTSNSFPSTMAAMMPLGLPVSEKLNKNNLQLWKLQVLPAIRGARLEEHLERPAPSPPQEIVGLDLGGG
jgi:hypothetical protein